MGTKLTKVLVAALLAILITGEAFCINSPIGSPTTPATANQSGLTPSNRGQYINSGNDIVTGNVGGGRQFRGVVPYGSSQYFGGATSTASSAVDSFVRNSTGVPYAADRVPAAIDPYYSPLRQVSSLSSRAYNNYGSTDSSALQIPQQSPLKQPLTFGLVPLAEAQKLQQQQNVALPETQTVENTQEYTPSEQRPLSSTPLEMQQYITEQIQGKLYPTEQQAQTEQPSPLQSMPQVALSKELGLNNTKKPYEPCEPGKTGEPGQPNVMPELTRGQPAKTPGIFEEMKNRIHDEFVKNLAQMAAQRTAAETNQPSEPNANAPRTEPLMPQAIVGYSRTFATQATDNFNRMMKAGEQYMKDKQYYKAADAYTIASIYQKNNPLPYAGKSFALLGAGEYMSSAYFLTRAVNAFPDYARFKVDLEAMFGDKEMLGKRITDIATWQEQSGSPELQFLLAYIYLQTDRLDLAQRMTNGALVKMPQSQALQILDKVIRLEIEQSKKTGKP